MAELELARLHEDGEHLVLRDPDGTEILLAITEALRAAVRRDRPRTEALQAQATTTLRPRELQARLRAGATAEELASESGLPVEHVQRYEWPVVAERAHVISQVRAHRRGGDGEPAPLGEVADTRLGARGVTADEARWSARRDGNAPWVVEVRFHAGDRDRSARWTYDPKGRVVTALDDEARWLGQPDDPVSPEMLGVPSVIARRAPAGPVHDASDDATTLLLDDLAGRRGQRSVGRVSVPGIAEQERAPEAGQAAGAQAADGDSAGTADVPTHASVVDLGSRRAGVRTVVDEPAAHGAAPSHPEPPAVTDGAADDAPAVRDPAEHPAEHPGAKPSAEPHAASPRGGRSSTARRGARKGRPQVPSWDEIVFGGRPTS